MSSASRGLPPRPTGGYAGAGSSQTSHPHQQHQMSYAYPPYYQHNMSSHYAQAYMQGMPTATPEGYTLSSAFLAQAQSSSSLAGSSSYQAGSSSLNSKPRWPGYQPGNHRCSKQGCTFTGSQKAVEIHMMDRHLIYPSGWNSRERKSDWDADPTLKGKQITIQGTSIALDTDEAIAAWIAERKKRFPTAERIAGKQQKMEEAVARGQLDVQVMHPNKRRRLESRGVGRGRGIGRGRGRGRGREGVSHRHQRTPGDAESTQIQHRPQIHHDLPKKPKVNLNLMGKGQDNEPATVAITTSDSDLDDDAPPEMASSKVKIDPPLQATDISTELEKSRPSPPLAAPTLVKKPAAKQPRRPPQNPFASRPALLRNLLLPEIRMTVSNLSQAIRFLVDNDFLEGVELSPGEGKKMIEVISETQADLETENLNDGT